MQLDWEKVAEVRAWLSKANDDLRAADAVIALEPPTLGVALFLAQQAAEKSMKGFLTWHDKAFRKSHNLVEIGKLCVAVDPTLEPLLREASTLTEYAWRFRYPGEPDVPSKQEALDALSLAKRTQADIIARLPAEVAPGFKP